MSKRIDLLRKINELAKRGVGGEKVNAQNQLDALLKKYNLTLEDIEGEKKDHFFLTATKEDYVLLHQIVCRIDTKITIGRLPDRKVKEYGLDGNVMIECTVANFIEIEQMYHVYLKLYKQELDLFYTAFLRANDLLVKNDDVQDEISDEEYEKWARIEKLSRNIKTETIRKQVEAHET